MTGIRVGIACSGLGHVRRGNETWAQTVAEALHARGTAVTLYGGAPRAGAACPYVHVPNLPRESRLLGRWLSWGCRYLLEQRTFAAALVRRLRRERVDLLHVADPALALRLRLDLPAGGPRVIYKDGLLLGSPWCRRFELVQVLSPFYREQAEAEGVDTRGWFVIPHFVDTERFHPPEDRAAARARPLDGRIGADRFVVLAVGDLAPESAKRLDWIVDEVARLPAGVPAELVLVGNATPEGLRDFRRRAAERLGGRVHVVAGVRPEEMPLWYRAADVFVHAALHEPFGIVFLEAMASGLPVVAHGFPVTAWIVGEGGAIVDMTEPGAAAGTLARWHADPAERLAAGARARRRAEEHFSRGRIVPLYEAAYAAAVAGR